MLRMNRLAGVPIAILVVLAVAAPPAVPQTGLPAIVPPPLPPQPKPEGAPEYEPINPDSEEPWELSQELLAPLYDKAALYAEFTRKFTCDEVARMAEYDGSGEVKNERVRRYGYVLVQDEIDHSVREYRQEFAKSGALKSGEVKDEEPFPPAYAWVFLFSRFNEPYFSFRYVTERFDGFDWVHEIQFKGALPFSNGKDIRQWEGTVLVDAVTYTPLEIHAEPAGQRERIEALFRQWSSSFNIMGMRTGKKPLGFRADIQFRYRDNNAGLTFPTDLRYDTFTAVNLHQTMPVRASTRGYSAYRIFVIGTEQEIGETSDP